MSAKALLFTALLELLLSLIGFISDRFRVRSRASKRCEFSHSPRRRSDFDPPSISRVADLQKTSHDADKELTPPKVSGTRSGDV